MTPARRTTLRHYLAFAGIILAGCPAKDPPDDGTLVVKLRVMTAPVGDLAGIRAIEFKTSRIEVVHRADDGDPTTESVVVVDPIGRSATVSVEEGNVVFLAALTVPKGFVRQVRFISNSIEADVNGSIEPVKLPSGERTGLKFVPQAPLVSFKIRPQRHTDIEGQFVPNNRIVFNKGQGLLLKPTVPTIDVTPELDAAGEPPPQFVPHQLYVLFHEGTSPQTIAQIHAGTGASVVRRNPLHPWDVVLLPTTLPETDALAYYRGKTEVRLAMLNYNAFRVNAFPEEWPKNADGSPNTRQWWLLKTESPGAWDIKAANFADVTGGSYLPIVAVVDSDINMFNRDLQENIFINQREIPTNVERDRNCQPLSTPLPLNTVDTTPGDGSEPADGLITLADINRSPNRERYNTILRQHLNQPNRPLDSRIDLADLVTPDPSFASPECGLWENLADDDGNGYPDDLVGWDFVRQANLPVDFVPNPGSAPSTVPLRDGTTVTNSGHAHTVAGVLGAVNNQKSGVPSQDLAADYVGQAWRLRILPARVLGGGEQVSAGSQGTIHEALAYVKALNADVVNMSFSLICAPKRDEVPERIQCSDSERKEKVATYRASFEVAGLDQGILITVGAIDAAVDLDDAEIQDLPAELLLPNQINVTATQQDDKHGSAEATCPGGTPKAGAISWGVKTYQLAAPGRCMFVLNYGGAGQFSSGVDSEPVGGTSLSAPQVAGVAALIIAVDPSMRGQPVALRDRILRNADVIEGLKNKVQGGKRLNARRAVVNEVQ